MYTTYINFDKWTLILTVVYWILKLSGITDGLGALGAIGVNP